MTPPVEESALFDVLRHLHECELYSDVIYLGGLLQTMCSHAPSLMSPWQRFQCAVFCGDAHYQLDEWRQASQSYYDALNMLRAIRGRACGVENVNDGATYTDNCELRFRLYKSLMRQTLYEEALGVLEAIERSQRSAKVNAALARQHARNGQSVFNSKMFPGPAAQNFEDLFEKTPLALQSISDYALWIGSGMTHVVHSELRQNTVKIEPTDEHHTHAKRASCSSQHHVAPDVIAQLQRAVALPRHITNSLVWLHPWLTVQYHISRNEYSMAAKKLRELVAKGQLASDPRLSIELGLLYNRCGEPDKAMLMLQRARSKEKFAFYGMDVLAALLYKDPKKRRQELETMASHMARINPNSPPVLTALSYSTLARGDKEEALHFADKAARQCESLVGNRQASQQALLAKAAVLIDMKATNLVCGRHLTEALALDMSNIDVYEALVDFKLERGDKTEALAYSKQCCNILGQQSPRALTLTAKVLEQDRVTLPQAQQMLELAIKNASYLLDAVFLLVSVYDRQNQYDKAIQLLRQQTALHVNSRLHQMLGDFLSKTNRAIEASDAYRHALTLNPSSPDASDGLAALDMMSPCLFEPMLAAFTTATSGSNSEENLQRRNDEDEQMDAQIAGEQADDASTIMDMPPPSNVQSAGSSSSRGRHARNAGASSSSEAVPGAPARHAHRPMTRSMRSQAEGVTSMRTPSSAGLRQTLQFLPGSSDAPSSAADSSSASTAAVPSRTLWPDDRSPSMSPVL